MLSARQQRLYTDRAALYRAVQIDDGNGVILGEQWGEVGTDIPCHFEIRPNFDTPEVFGRVQSDNLFVIDILHLPETQEVGADYMVLNLTREPDGTPSQNFGHWWRVRGVARQISQRGGRHAQKKQVYVFLVPEPPIDLVTIAFG